MFFENLQAIYKHNLIKAPTNLFNFYFHTTLVGRFLNNADVNQGCSWKKIFGWQCVPDLTFYRFTIQFHTQHGIENRRNYVKYIIQNLSALVEENIVWTLMLF